VTSDPRQAALPRRSFSVYRRYERILFVSTANALG